MPKPEWHQREIYDPMKDPPFCIQIEPTEGCNLRCEFCGINGIRGEIGQKDAFKFMTVETARSLAEQIKKLGWTPRFEFAMHGEPTLNKKLCDIISVIDDYLPDSYKLIETNGAGLVGDPGEKILALYRAGINTVALDEYQNVDLVPRIKEKLWANGGHIIKAFADFGIHTYFYPHQVDGNPHHREMKKRRLVFIQPLDLATEGTHSVIYNHSGVGAPKNFKREGKRCAKPFRELSIRWDGNVSICCSDWRGVVKAGNVLEDGIAKIWSGRVFQAARKMLYRGRREFGPCHGCDYVSYRTGFLPDQKGNKWIDEPSPLDLNVLNYSMEGEPYSPVVLRPWESDPRYNFVQIEPFKETKE